MDENILCDVCNAPFFNDDSAITSEPCHFGRNNGYYCGLCYTFLLALKNNGVPNTTMRIELLMKYIKYLEENMAICLADKLNTVGNVVDASELFGEDYNGID